MVQINQYLGISNFMENTKILIIKMNTLEAIIRNSWLRLPFQHNIMKQIWHKPKENNYSCFNSQKNLIVMTLLGFCSFLYKSICRGLDLELALD